VTASTGCSSLPDVKSVAYTRLLVCVSEALTEAGVGFASSHTTTLVVLLLVWVL
jgi:hypothetical protein